MKWLLVLLFLVILIGIYNNSLGHFPEGVTYLAVGIPDDKLPKIDGDLSDWDWAPKEFALDRTAFLREYGVYHPDSLLLISDPKVLVGWNDTANKLFFACEIKLNSRIIPEAIYKENFGIEFFVKYMGKQQYDLIASIPSRFPPLVTYYVPDWAKLTPYIEYDWKIYETDFLRYELAIVPFDSLDQTGPTLSKTRKLIQGDSVRLDILITEDSSIWGTNAGGLEMISKDPSLFFLSSSGQTSVEKTSLGKLKASFRGRSSFK